MKIAKKPKPLPNIETLARNAVLARDAFVRARDAARSARRAHVDDESGGDGITSHWAPENNPECSGCSHVRDLQITATSLGKKSNSSFRSLANACNRSAK